MKAIRASRSAQPNPPPTAPTLVGAFWLPASAGSKGTHRKAKVLQWADEDVSESIEKPAECGGDSVGFACEEQPEDIGSQAQDPRSWRDALVGTIVYPPEKQEKATETVLAQAELLCEGWVQ